MAKLDKLKNPGKKTDGENTGKSSEEIADVLGVSPRTAERMRNIINNADEETLEAVKSGEMSISKADKLTNEKKQKKSKKVEDENLDDDISEALEDNEGNPGGLSFMQEHPREDPNKLTPEQDSERTLERKRAYEGGFAEGFKKGFAEGSYQVYDKIISMLHEGKTVVEIENDNLFSDFTFSEIAPKFEIATADEELLKEFNT